MGYNYWEKQIIIFGTIDYVPVNWISERSWASIYLFFWLLCMEYNVNCVKSLCSIVGGLIRSRSFISNTNQRVETVRYIANQRVDSSLWSGTAPCHLLFTSSGPAIWTWYTNWKYPRLQEQVQRQYLTFYFAIITRLQGSVTSCYWLEWLLALHSCLCWHFFWYPRRPLCGCSLLFRCSSTCLQ